MGWKKPRCEETRNGGVLEHAAACMKQGKIDKASISLSFALALDRAFANERMNPPSDHLPPSRSAPLLSLFLPPHFCYYYLYCACGIKGGACWCKTSLSYEAGEGGAERSDRRGACWTSSDTRTRNLSLMVSSILVYSMLVIRWCSCVLALALLRFFLIFLILSVWPPPSPSLRHESWFA